MPALVSIIVTSQAAGGVSPWHTVWNIVLQLLVPFVAGQLLRPMIGNWIDRNRAVLKYVDQGSILLVVYAAFSEAVTKGLWHHIPLSALGGLLIACAVLLALALTLTMLISKRLGFSRADQITIVFCGSKKSLAAGVPMAKVIFATHAVGAAVLPLMLFHQIQLMTCAALAQRWGARETNTQKRAAQQNAAASVSGGRVGPRP